VKDEVTADVTVGANIRAATGMAKAARAANAVSGATVASEETAVTVSRLARAESVPRVVEVAMEVGTVAANEVAIRTVVSVRRTAVLSTKVVGPRDVAATAAARKAAQVAANRVGRRPLGQKRIAPKPIVQKQIGRMLFVQRPIAPVTSIGRKMRRIALSI
jgi:hypothetical protein